MKNRGDCLTEVCSLQLWLNNNNNKQQQQILFIVPKAEYYTYLQVVKLIN